MTTVLVVDDEPDMLLLLRMTFEAAGYTVIEAANGAAALRAIEEGPAPDLVITDLMMPVMDGRELIGRLRGDPRTADTPVMVVTANPTETIGADALVRKPFRPREIVEVAGSLLQTD